MIAEATKPKRKRKPDGLNAFLDSTQELLTKGKKLPEWQVKEFRRLRPEFFGEASEETNVPARIGNQSKLAELLQQKFEGRCRIIISSRQINYWREGQHLKPVVVDGKKMIPPPFPPKESDHFNVPKCIEWVEKWLLPIHGIKNGEEHAGTEIVDYAAESERLDFEEKKVRADAMKERYVLRVDAENQALADLQFLLGIFRKAGEIDSCKTRLDWVMQRWQNHLPAGEIELFRAMNDASERQRVDFVEAECQRMAQATPEYLQELAKELAEKLTGKIAK